MNLISSIDLWKPKLRLNTDIFPICKMKQTEKKTIITSSPSIDIKKGDYIKTGQKISEDCISPYTGTVENIGHIKGLDFKNSIFITMLIHSKEECTGDIKKISSISEVSEDTLLSALRKLGYEYIPDSSVETVIINVLDRDPICTVNHQLFRENTKLLPDCIELIKKVSGCSRIVFAITKQLSNIAKRSVGNYVEIAVIDPIYPNGFHEILVNRIFPNEKNSIKNSVIDLEYLLSMLIAVNSGKPYQDKVITLYAPDQSIEKNIQVKIGTPISEIFKEFNIELEDEFKVVINGAMSGVAWYNLNYPVTNFIHSIMVQNRQNVYKTENISCMNCGKCVAVCPVNLQVNLIGRYSEYRKFEECIRLDVGSCIECGLCAYSCTAHRPLVHYIRHAKVTINQKKEEII